MKTVYNTAKFSAIKEVGIRSSLFGQCLSRLRINLKLATAVNYMQYNSIKSSSEVHINGSSYGVGVHLCQY